MSDMIYVLTPTGVDRHHPAEFNRFAMREKTLQGHHVIDEYGYYVDKVTAHKHPVFPPTVAKDDKHNWWGRFK